MKHLTINPYMVNFDLTGKVDTNRCIYKFSKKLTVERGLNPISMIPKHFSFVFSIFTNFKIEASTPHNLPFYSSGLTTSNPN